MVFKRNHLLDLVRVSELGNGWVSLAPDPIGISLARLSAPPLKRVWCWYVLAQRTRGFEKIIPIYFFLSNIF